MSKKTSCDQTNFTMQYACHTRNEMLKFIPVAAQRLLDVGCYTGSFGQMLKNNCAIEIWGIETMPEAANQARKVLDQVINETLSADTNLPDDYFDVVVFNDVLEHMIDPWEVLKLVRRKLRDGGCVVASIPNMRNIDNLLHIVCDGDFCYGPWGVRDRNHLRFFTRKSAIRLFMESGYTVEQVEGINENWWTTSILRRAAFKIFHRQLAETKYNQFAFVAKPNRN